MVLSRVRRPPITLRKGCCPRSVSSFPAWSRHRSPRDRGPFSWPASPENVPNTIDNESAHEQHTNRSLPSLIHMEHKYEVDRLKHVNNTWHGPATCRQAHRFDSHDAKSTLKASRVSHHGASVNQMAEPERSHVMVATIPLAAVVFPIAS